LNDLLQQGDDLLDIADLLVGQQDQRIVQNSFHLLGISDHVGRQEATVDLHAFHDLAVSLSGLGFFHGDDAVSADLFHSLSNQGTDLLVTGRNGADTSDILAAVNRLRVLLNGLHSDLGCLGHALVHHNGVGSGNQVLQALMNDGLGQQGSCGGAVAGHVVGLGRDFLHHLGAHVLKGVFQLDLLGDGHAVICNQGGAISSPQNHIAALRTEGDFYGIGQLINATLQRLTSFFSITQHFCHNL